MLVPVPSSSSQSSTILRFRHRQLVASVTALLSRYGYTTDNGVSRSKSNTSTSESKGSVGGSHRPHKRAKLIGDGEMSKVREEDEHVGIDINIEESSQIHSDKGNDDILGDLQKLLDFQSLKEETALRISSELKALISSPTAKEILTKDAFRSAGGPEMKEFCEYGTISKCKSAFQKSMVDGSGAETEAYSCPKQHFRRLILRHTDTSLGDCSFLDRCSNMSICQFVHYELEDRDGDDGDSDSAAARHAAVKATIPSLSAIPTTPSAATTLQPAQWINCDARTLDMAVLGKFDILYLDPPWAINQSLPYNTLSDDVMRTLSLSSLVDNGLIFLCVTLRTLELGRECMKLWGFKPIQEIIWVCLVSYSQLSFASVLFHLFTRSILLL